jgi:uncharacterized protein YabE (DUF348 family)
MQFFKGIPLLSNSMLKRALALAVMIIITVSAVATVAAATCNANINYNGETKRVQLFSSDTESILNAAGIKTTSQDLILRNENQPGGDINITVKSAYQVKLNENGQVRTVTVHYGDTVADVLSAAGITLGANDGVSPSAETAVSNGMNVTVNRKCNVTIIADGKTQTVTVNQGSVEKALSQAGITVDSDDLISAAKTDEVSDGMKLTISRVEYQEITDVQTIAYKNINVNDNTLRKGVKKIRTAGKNGSQKVVMRQKLIDGKVASSEVVSTTVVQQPVDQVTLVGTKKVSSAYASISSDGTVVDQNGNTVNYSKCITGKCSAYTGGGRTSTGKAAAFGLVAVNPKIIPYGSRLYICSTDGKVVYGYAIAADTGGGVMSGNIVADLYYDTVSQCRNFGVRNMRIYILK